MTNEILIFRTDRIGDLLLTCPSIKTIKENYPDSNLNIVTSEKNFYYAKTFEFFDEVYLCPKGSFLKKIKLFFKLYKKKFDYIFIFDGKDRSIISSAFIKSKNKFAITSSSRNNIFCKILKINFFQNCEKESFEDIFIKLRNYLKMNSNEFNYNFLSL